MKAIMLVVASVLLFVSFPTHSFAQNWIGDLIALSPTSGHCWNPGSRSQELTSRTLRSQQNVSFNGVVANLISWNSTTIVVTVPSALIPGDTTVVVKGPRGFGVQQWGRFPGAFSDGGWERGSSSPLTDSPLQII